jgi:hypothetical protein
MDNLGLFDTLVPIASILTISVLVGYTLPREQYLGLFLLVWWTLSVALSLSNSLFSSRTQWDFPRDVLGAMIFFLFPLTMSAALFFLYQWCKSIRTFILKKVPLWALILLNVYRMDGASLLYPYLRGDIPKYLGLQTLLLDIGIGATTLPIAWLVYHSTSRRGGGSGGRGRGSRWVASRLDPKTIHQLVWLWNSLGLYDLTSAYVVFGCNVLGVGGHFIAEPALAMVGFHPLPLIVLFQAPLAMCIHIFFLTHYNRLMEQEASLPLYANRRL